MREKIKLPLIPIKTMWGVITQREFILQLTASRIDQELTEQAAATRNNLQLTSKPDPPLKEEESVYPQQESNPSSDARKVGALSTELS